MYAEQEELVGVIRPPGWKIVSVSSYAGAPRPDRGARVGRAASRRTHSEKIGSRAAMRACRASALRRRYYATGVTLPRHKVIRHGVITIQMLRAQRSGDGTERQQVREQPATAAIRRSSRAQRAARFTRSLIRRRRQHAARSPSAPMPSSRESSPKPPSPR